MKTRFYYFFAAGVCVLFLFLLLTVDKNKETNQNPQHKSHDMLPNLTQNTQATQDDDGMILATAPQTKNTDVKAFAAFQRIADKLHKFGITINGVVIDIKDGIVKWTPETKWDEYYGNPSSHAHAIAPGILQQHHVLRDNPQGIIGCYQTNWGLLRLYIKDDVVTGIFNYYGRNHIIGKLKDNIIVGLWIRPAKNKRPMIVGPIQFAFAEKWSSFKGVWRYKQYRPFEHMWEGSKIKCPPEGPKPHKPTPGGPGVP